jgi:enoyl-CoA hydratase/carnithine racemase
MKHITVERDGVDHLITLNRPERRNALSEEMLEELVATLEGVILTLEGIEDAPHVPVVTVIGAGEVFCAGADVSQFTGIENRYERNRAFAAWVPRIAELIERVVDLLGSERLVSIAAINGSTIGGGWLLALGCDFRIAVEEAEFWFPEASLGRVVGDRTVELLVSRVGHPLATEILMLSERESAAQLASWGLVNRVVAPHDLADEVEAMTNRLRGIEPGVLRELKAKIASYPLTI